MIPQDEYNFIVAYESAKTKEERDEVLNRDKHNSVKCIIGLATENAKDVLIRYVLTVLDDMLLEASSNRIKFCALNWLSVSNSINPDNCETPMGAL